MSHEIRTPMNGVTGMLHLRSMTELTPEQEKYTKVAQKSGLALLSLIDDILDLSKIEAGKIVLGNSPDVPLLLRGDPDRLRQVLTNLLSNAIKFTQHGEIKLLAIVEACHDNQATLRFTVNDTGVGIKADRIGALFSPFVQADDTTTREYGGTGLGLAICKQLVGILGGRIGVSSREGHGSSFWFTAVLERPNQIHQQPDNLPAQLSGPNRQTFTKPKARVLVVEDNPVNRMVLIAQLEKLGYEADEVTNGADATEAVQHQSYGLVLMYCQMPVMDGFEATRRIRTSVEDRLAIIAVTADALSEDRDRCLREGMTDYISKPVDLKVLANLLAKWLPTEASDQMASARVLVGA